jgi:hypothetical protein
VPVWNDHARVRPGPANTEEIIPPSPIFPGRFAVARFRGENLSWVGYDTLVLDVRSAGEDRLVIVLSEYDDGMREDYTILMESVPPGKRSLRFRLAPVPDGDLSPSPLTRDGEWNPDDVDGVNVVFSSYPEGFVIEGMRLEMSEISEGATK